MILAVTLMLGVTGTVTHPMSLEAPFAETLSLVKESSTQERYVVRVPQDFPTIQAAVDAVAEGGTVLIGPGIYKENLTITKSVRLVGAGQEQVQLQYTDPDHPIIQIIPEDFVQIHFQNLTIGDPAFPIEQVDVPPTLIGPKLAGRGLKIFAPVQMVLRRVTIGGLISGVDLFPLGRYLVIFPSQVILEEVKLVRNWVGLASLGVHLLVVRSKIEENIIGGLIGAHEERILFSQSSISRNREFGINLILGSVFGNTPFDFIVEENEFKQNGVGIVMSNAREGNSIRIEGNRFVQNKRYGIAIVDPTCPIDPLISLPKIPLIQIFGGGNEFHNNGQDLCPLDYPWPPGFRK